MSAPLDVEALARQAAHAVKEKQYHPDPLAPGPWWPHIFGVIEPVISRLEQERDEASRRHAQHMHFCLTSKYDAKIVDQAEAALGDMDDPPGAVSDLVQIARDALREVGTLRSQLAAGVNALVSPEANPPAATGEQSGD